MFILDFTLHGLLIIIFVLNELYDIPCEFDFDWKDYKKFEVILDKRYDEAF